MLRIICFLFLTLAVASKNMASGDKDDKHKHKVQPAIILTYNKKKIKSVDDLVNDVKEMCGDCKIERLDTFGVLIAHFKNANHPPASEFKAIKGIESASENSAIQTAH